MPGNEAPSCIEWEFGCARLPRFNPDDIPIDKAARRLGAYCGCLGGYAVYVGRNPSAEPGEVYAVILDADGYRNGYGWHMRVGDG